MQSYRLKVPNVPCGVERKHIAQINQACFPVFLMYRVELKVEFSDVISDFRMTVPNVPCGVEIVNLKVGIE